MRKFLIFILPALIAFLAGCIEDGIDTSPSAQPAFSCDTLDIGPVFTGELTVTSRMTVYNRNSKGLNISRISLSGENAPLFRINVDGMSGKDFSDVEIRAKDSIFVFIEAVLPENGVDLPIDVEASLDFTTNGRTESVLVTAQGQDIVRMQGVEITEDASLKAGKPYRIADSLVVRPEATLVLEEGVKLLFRDKARLVVHGRLLSKGTPQAPVTLTGDRIGEVLTGVSFEIMSRQWDGVEFMPGSKGNELAFTVISNTVNGVAVRGDGSGERELLLENCRLRNSGGYVLEAEMANVEAYGCEFAEAGMGLVALSGGDYRFDQCTLSNHYLFSAITDAAWNIVSPEDGVTDTRLYATNCITWGLGQELLPKDISGRPVTFSRCLFKSAGTDDDNFIDCLWDADPLFYTERSEYLFDYRLKPDSPAIGAADPSLSEHPLAVDFYGAPRANDLGAYAFAAPEE
ncbi:MAG: hypothetical protein NC102_02475 [Clostridium sp.]|nr:hypothetical protein [Clostridium sp.]